MTAAALRLMAQRLRVGALPVAAAALAVATASASPHTRSESAVAVHRPYVHQALSNKALWVADVRQLYRVDRELGRGGFGMVHVATERQSDARVALKRVAKQTTTKAKFLQEAAILTALGGRHNVVGLRDFFETADAYVLVTELVDGRELFDHLVDNGVFTEPRAQALVRSVAQSLAYLHAHQVVHGDLKPENILVSHDAADMRLIDFGQSFREHDASERACCLGSGVATVAYAAPEVLLASVASAAATMTTATSAIDLWGLGVVLFIVLCGFHPFDPENDATDAQLATRICSGDFDRASPEWRELPPQARDLIEKLLQVDPAQRLSADDVLQHAWLMNAEQAVEA